jgi:catechol 2,3-dioxygenase-like lactoylglutathione lyase family enzyme
MAVKRMDNVGIVVEDIDAAIEFFTELGLELEGRTRAANVPSESHVTGTDPRVKWYVMSVPSVTTRIGSLFT